MVIPNEVPSLLAALLPRNPRYLNSVATYAHGTIRNWPSSTRAEAAAIYAALSVTPANSTVTIYTDSQAAIDGLNSCASSTYTNSRLFYKTTNFELWASIERLVHTQNLAVSPVKVKGHDGNYWNEFADSLANSAHHSDMAPLMPQDAYTSSHPVRLVYDTVVCESNPRRLLKLHFQATFLKDLLSLKRFQFVYCLFDKDDYVVDWELTWFTLNFFPAHDASFQASHAARHYTFKFKLFFDDLPLLEKLKVTRSDLYIDLLTCRSCRDRMEDLMHLILCSKRRSVMHQILQSYQNHLFSKLREAGEMADQDPTPLLRKLSSLSCWTISSSNWSSYALIWRCLPTMFVNLFVDLSIPKPTAMKVVAAIHNNFIQKLRTRIWNLRTYDKSIWEDAMNITLKLKTAPRPSNLPATSYVPFSSLPPPTHLVTSRDSEVDWIKNSMTQGWDVDFYSGRVIRYFVSIVASTLLREAGELADQDPTPLLRKLSSLSCWTISSSNWSSYALIRGCLPAMFIDLFVNLSILRPSAMKVVAAIHNNFIQKLRTRIWNLRTHDKSKWEDAMNITLKLKTTPRPSNLPATSDLPTRLLFTDHHFINRVISSMGLFHQQKQ
ncbi:hypothetical protein RclHR1_00360003 [Rhizophagus clarus]|uniref:RNase H type-1 domain-containing protein n=1 Tax=Rhizophagus clarus TaxID=94130 RepID=A0A2Z6RN71_9GLOM|nr:hypothetical protein RclHR1_00360003 [Rhizophagus clarus]